MFSHKSSKPDETTTEPAGTSISQQYGLDDFMSAEVDAIAGISHAAQNSAEAYSRGNSEAVQNEKRPDFLKTIFEGLKRGQSNEPRR